MHCPFCGEEEKLSLIRASFTPQSSMLAIARVQCASCGACGPAEESTRRETADLIAEQSWNDRLEHAEDLALRIAFTMLSN